KSGVMASPARVSAHRAQIQQVVSYITLNNVTIDGGAGTMRSNEINLKLPQQPYQQQQQQQQQQLLSISTGAPPVLGFNRSDSNATGYVTASSSQLSNDLMYLWLGVFLAIPLLLGLLLFCLCVNRKDDEANKSLIDRDSESGLSSEVEKSNDPINE
uniref:Uncharacterized protein n=1 Tax=Macrostomum lignano TaxID=282301 RepID=A0A1I8HFD0_9PLAT